jgi:hypothetical protein
MASNKTSLLALVASLLVSVTRATTTALATRREDEDRSISRTDVGFTVVGIVCELYACRELYKWMAPGTNTYTFNRGNDGKCTSCGKAEGDHYNGSSGTKYCDNPYKLNPGWAFVCLLADIGFQVGKMFPGSGVLL